MTVIGKHKRVLVDVNFLIAAISNQTSKSDQERVEFFLSELQKNNSVLIIPTPVVAEFFVKADAARRDLIRQLQGKSYVQIASFDMATAVECSLLDAAALNTGDKRGGVDKSWQHIKIDRQIVAIGRVHNVTLVISGDKGVRNNASRANIEALTIGELPLPPKDPQGELPV